jgi:hypothetical protein
LARFVDVALANVAKEYPYHIVHLARSDDDVLPPRTLYPAFHGSYDWHSCVHMHWSLVRLHSLASGETGPAAALRARIAAHLDTRLTPAAIAGEVHYFESRGHAAFERPYGWAWLLLLAAELEALGLREQQANAWRAALEPLVQLLRARLLAWLPRADFPIRAGTHGNTAFALVLAGSFALSAPTLPGNTARRGRDTELVDALREATRRWYGADEAFPAQYEPSGDDFLSGGLCEALACARLLPRAELDVWWRRFEPTTAGLLHWSSPVVVSDATDPKTVHLAGLNLSRAWCWRELAPSLPREVAALARTAADAHLVGSLAAATSGDYVGTHWLASFALLALTGDRPTG